LQEIRSVMYEDHVKESVEATTVLMEQSNHILKDGYHEDAAPISRNFFEEERNTVMAGDLRQDNRDRKKKQSEMNVYEERRSSAVRSQLS